jgi:large subunit ribosomal protein L28
VSQICDKCGKKPLFGNNVSHSHKKSRRRWTPNIQQATVMVNGVPTKMSLCTKCMKKQASA